MDVNNLNSSFTRIGMFWLVSLFVSCSPRVTSHLNSPYGPLAKDETVSVLPVGSEVPGAAERLGVQPGVDAGDPHEAGRQPRGGGVGGRGHRRLFLRRR